MATDAGPRSTTPADVNGAAMAAMLAAGIGAFSMAFFVVLNEAGVFAAPALYGPAGGVTGRTTFATLVWLIAWGVLHTRWRAREIAPRRVFWLTLALIGAGVLGTFPPLWGTAVTVRRPLATQVEAQMQRRPALRPRQTFDAERVGALEHPGRPEVIVQLSN